MPIILTTNEVMHDHSWNDVTGEKYHYPNGYKNRITLGERFIYYRGVHRKGGKRGFAEYFGHGRIGAITKDPNSKNSSRPDWYCGVEDFQPFPNPVGVSLDSGLIENVIHDNHWRVAVREITVSQYDTILSRGFLSSKQTIAPVAPVEAKNLLMPASLVVGSSANKNGWRKSKRAKEIGDWAEVAAFNFIREKYPSATIVHRAALGETPGWDLDYIDEGGQIQRVEVKGTVAGAFPSIDLTINEFNAAQTHAENYWLYLIANCLTDAPIIQRVKNPGRQMAEGCWSASPILFNVKFSAPV